MIKEAIQLIAEMSNGAVLNAAGRFYSRHDVRELASPAAVAKPLESFHTLSGFADYIKASFDLGELAEEGGTKGGPARYGVFVDGADKVELVSSLFGDFRQRETLAVAKPFTAVGFPFGKYVDVESFVVGIQSAFVQDESTAAVLQVVGNVTDHSEATVLDDGMSQQVTAKAGIARLANVKVPNPVQLRPFRTFCEVTQPSSCFVLRLKRGGDGSAPQAALFQVADEMWRAKAAAYIKAHLAKSVGLPVFA